MAEHIKRVLNNDRQLGKVMFIVGLVLVITLSAYLVVSAQQRTGDAYGYNSFGYSFGYGYWTQENPTLTLKYNGCAANCHITSQTNVTVRAEFSQPPHGQPDLALTPFGDSPVLPFSQMNGSGSIFTLDYFTGTETVDSLVRARVRTQNGLGFTPTPQNRFFTVTPATQQGGGGGSLPNPTEATGPTIPVSTTGSIIATPQEGGAVTFSPGLGVSATITIPPGAVDNNTLITITEGSNDGTTPPEGTGYIMIGGQVYEISAIDQLTGLPVTNFVPPLTLTFTYTDAQLAEAGVAEETLAIFLWNETTQQWVQLPGTVDPVNNTVTATTTHFSLFALMALQPGDSASPDGGMVQLPGAPNLVDGSYVPHVGTPTNLAAEDAAVAYFTALTGHSPSGDEWTVVHFIAYGTAQSSFMSMDDRMGVIGDYYEVYNRVPTTNDQWKNIALILSSTHPAEVNMDAERRALAEFIRVYNRLPNFKNVNDEWAIHFIAYKLRAVVRQLDQEQDAIGVFRSVYKLLPSSSHHWAIVRAIAYSGAAR